MKKKILILFYLFLYISIIFAQNKISDISTTLVVVEEQENGNFVIGNAPVTNGIFESLWDINKYIFFDINIERSLSIIQNQLDVEPFLDIAKASGADSILLIKFHYSIKKEKNRLRINADEVFYNLYSLNHLKSLKVGKKSLKINKYINVSIKTKVLKEIGNKIITEIYK